MSEPYRDGAKPTVNLSLPVLPTGQHDKPSLIQHVMQEAVCCLTADGAISALNPAAENLLVMSEANAKGKDFWGSFAIYHRNDSDFQARSESLKQQLQANHAIEHDDALLCLPQGREIPINYRCLPMIDGDVLQGFICFFTNIAAQKAREANLLNRAEAMEQLSERQSKQLLSAISSLQQTQLELDYYTSCDVLTGLNNRAEFERQLERLIQSSQQHHVKHTLVYCDLDQFKVVNDNSSHEAGDALLKKVADILKKQLRTQDIIARLGGDEFGILLVNTEPTAALPTVEALRKSLQGLRFVWQGNQYVIGVSIGVTGITAESRDLAQVFTQVDTACYIAKELGRNRVHVYQEKDELIAHRSGQLSWVSKINHALENDRFVLYAQIIEPLEQSSEKIHYEMLVRMRDDDDQLIPPGLFLPAAESYHLMERIDEWVLTQTCQTLAKMPAHLEELGCCSINLSAQSLMRNDFLDFVSDLLDTTKVPPQKLCFEITETAAIANLECVKRCVTALRERGCRFSLDDFGSGMASFAYLKHLPVDYLKIDGQFIKDMVDDPIDYAMVKSMNEIGQVMGKQTIAEFVENDAIKERLRSLGVNYVQGYGIAKPVAWNEILNG